MIYSNYLAYDSAAGIVAINKEYKIVSVNETALSILADNQSAEAELIGQSFVDLFHQGMDNEQSGQYLSCLAKTMETGKSCIHSQIHFRDKTLVCDTSIIYGKQREIEGAFVVMRDVTKERVLEERLRQTEKFAMIGQLSAGLAHELLNPMTVIKGFLQLYKAKILPEDSWEILLAEVNKIHKLVSDFLLLTNPSAPKYQTVRMDELLKNVAGQFEPMAEQHSIGIELEIEESLPPIPADLHQIRQVFVNLFLNAMDCLTRGGIIRITAAADADLMKISVFNNGPVIPTEIRSRIFDPFFTTKAQGIGLGLAITYRIVENHGGEMFVESRDGVGTTFTIKLPYMIPNGEIQ